MAAIFDLRLRFAVPGEGRGESDGGCRQAGFQTSDRRISMNDIATVIDLAQFRRQVETETTMAMCPTAIAIEKNIPIYDGASVDDGIGPEWASVIGEGPGVFVVKRAFTDPGAIDAAISKSSGPSVAAGEPSFCTRLRSKRARMLSMARRKTVLVVCFQA